MTHAPTQAPGSRGYFTTLECGKGRPFTELTHGPTSRPFSGAIAFDELARTVTAITGRGSWVCRACWKAEVDRLKKLIESQDPADSPAPWIWRSSGLGDGARVTACVETRVMAEASAPPGRRAA